MRGFRRRLWSLPRARARASVARRSRAVTLALLAYERRQGSFQRRTFSDVVDLLERVPASIVTIDVFDTVIIRAVLRDETVWWLTAAALRDEGLWSASEQDFVGARRAAAAADPGAALEGLYAGAALAARSVGAGAMCEERVEAALARPVPGAAEGLQRLRSAGHRITFLSDMHLAPSVLQDRLQQAGLWGSGDKLAVSSNMAASKADGTLFPKLQAQGQAPAWHIGNDLWGDVAMATSAGVRVAPCRAAEPNRLEELMAAAPVSIGDVLAGAARQVRTAGAGLAADDAALWEVGADVAGQCLGAFLLWVRDQCKADGVTDVCFMARDGALPLAMARALPADHWEGLNLRYVQGSRRLWSLAAGAALGVDEWLAAGCADDSAFLRQNQHLLPWGSLLERASLVPGDLAGHPELEALRLDGPLPASLDGAWRKLLADARVRATLAERVEEQLHDLRELLLADGALTGRVAMVDVGWRGQLAWQISAVVRAISGHEPVHLHFGGVDVAPDLGDVVIRRFAVDDSTFPLPFPDIVSCVETMTASGAQRARAVRRGSEGAVELVFDPAVEQMDTAARRLLWQAAEQVAACLPSRATLGRWRLPSGDLDARVRAVLTEFWTTPSPVHARAGAQLAAEIDDAGINVHQVARSYGSGDLSVWSAVPSRTWRQGSLRLTPAPLRWILTPLLHARDRHRDR